MISKDKSLYFDCLDFTPVVSAEEMPSEVNKKNTPVHRSSRGAQRFLSPLRLPWKTSGKTIQPISPSLPAAFCPNTPLGSRQKLSTRQLYQRSSLSYRHDGWNHQKYLQ
jgi:hypothetical protein